MSQTCIQLDLGMKLDKPSNLKTLWCHSCRLFKLQSFNKPFPPQWSRCNHEHWWLWAVAAATRLKPHTWSGLGLADDSEGQPFHPSTLVFHCHTGGLRLWRFQLGHQLMHSWFEPRPRYGIPHEDAVGVSWRLTELWPAVGSSTELRFLTSPWKRGNTRLLADHCSRQKISRPEASRKMRWSWFETLWSIRLRTLFGEVLALVHMQDLNGDIYKKRTSKRFKKAQHDSSNGKMRLCHATLPPSTT